jgi:hypothetical protein
MVDLEQALDRHGGNLGRWPATLRADAEVLIARDPKAARLAAHAARLDGILLEAIQPLAVDAALIGRVIAGIDNGARHDTVLRPTPRLAAWAGAAMIAFLSAGYVAGLLLPASQGEDTLAGLMFGSSATATDTDSANSGNVL